MTNSLPATGSWGDHDELEFGVGLPHAREPKVANQISDTDTGSFSLVISWQFKMYLLRYLYQDYFSTAVLFLARIGESKRFCSKYFK